MFNVLFKLNSNLSNVRLTWWVDAIVLIKVARTTFLILLFFDADGAEMMKNQK